MQHKNLTAPWSLTLDSGFCHPREARIQGGVETAGITAVGLYQRTPSS